MQRRDIAVAEFDRAYRDWLKPLLNDLSSPTTDWVACTWGFKRGWAGSSKRDWKADVKRGMTWWSRKVRRPYAETLLLNNMEMLSKLSKQIEQMLLRVERNVWGTTKAPFHAFHIVTLERSKHGYPHLHFLIRVPVGVTPQEVQDFIAELKVKMDPPVLGQKALTTPAYSVEGWFDYLLKDRGLEDEVSRGVFYPDGKWGPPLIMALDMPEEYKARSLRR